MADSLPPHVRNVHARTFRAPPAAVGALIDTLASAHDRLWPRDRWPAMRFDRPLGVGATGGHGPIRYTVEAYEPGRMIRFRFDPKRGFLGTHALEVAPTADGGTELRHVLDMDTVGQARWMWPMVFQPLHDALLEDALDRAAVSLGERPVGAPWTLAVRLLRRLVTRINHLRGRTYGAARGNEPTS